MKTLLAFIALILACSSQAQFITRPSLLSTSNGLYAIFSASVGFGGASNGGVFTTYTGFVARSSSMTMSNEGGGLLGIHVAGGSGDAGGTNARQFGSLNLTNWSLLATGDMANVPAVNFLTNWANAISNLTVANTNSGGFGQVNVNQFSTNANQLAVKDGAQFTNITDRGSMTVIGQVTAGNVASDGAITSAADGIFSYDTISDTLMISNSFRVSGITIGTSISANTDISAPSFTVPSGNLASLIAARQYGSASLTNLSGNPNVATNIIGAGTVTVSSNNAGVWTITGGGGGSGWSGSYAVASNAVFVSGATNHTNVTIVQSIGQLVPMFAMRGSNGTMLSGFDEHGHLVLSNIPPAGRPITNNIEIEGEFLGRVMPKWMDDASNSYPFDAFSHRRIEISPATSTRLSAWGTSPVTNVAATVSHPGANEFLPDMFQVASGAGSNASASVGSERAIAFSGTMAGANGWFFAAEWASTNGIIHFGGGGVGHFVGMSDIAAASQTNMSAFTNNASTRYAGFAVHGQLGAGATNWHFITKDNAGGNEVRVDTTLPLLASNLYRGWIHCPPQGRTLGVRLDNLTAGTTTSFFATASVPTNGLRMLATITNRTNLIHSLRVSRMYLEAPTAP